MKMHILLATTAIVGFAALPVSALMLDTSVPLGSYSVVLSEPDMDDSTGAATGDNAQSVADVAVDGAAQTTDVNDSTGPSTGDNVASAPDPTVMNTQEAATDSEDSTGAATGDEVASAPAPSPAMSTGMTLDVESAFNADSVLAADGEKIGVVDQVVIQADGSKLLVVLVDGGMPSEARFTLAIDGAAESDGQVDLGWTKAELMTAIQGL